MDRITLRWSSMEAAAAATATDQRRPKTSVCVTLSHSNTHTRSRRRGIIFLNPASDLENHSSQSQSPEQPLLLHTARVVVRYPVLVAPLSASLLLMVNSVSSHFTRVCRSDIKNGGPFNGRSGSFFPQESPLQYTHTHPQRFLLRMCV